MDELATTAVDRYWSAIRAAAGRALGHDPGTGTIVVPTPDREGSDVAVVYPARDVTLIWCSPRLAPTLNPLVGAHPLAVEEFVSACVPLGGDLVAYGNQRVLTTAAPMPDIDPSRLVSLDPTDREHVELLRRFLQECPEDDVDEAEIDIDELDSAITVILTETAQIAAYASGRPWGFDPQFDDIGVLTHPHHRGHRLGSTAVAAFARRQQAADRIMFYNCDVENVGSNRVAETVGFQLVATVAGVSFPSSEALMPL
ncbi:MAG: GNAT family N-acetyltransferase [Acidimicrobiales bacterium]